MQKAGLISLKLSEVGILIKYYRVIRMCMKMNIMFCSVGRRGELIKNFKQSMGEKVTIVATDSSAYAPALYLADKRYIVPKINEEKYIPYIIEICKREHINAITTFIDPEIEILAKHRKQFEELGVVVLAPYEETAGYCFDKFKMFCYLKEHGINTVPTYDTYETFEDAYEQGEIEFPVFVKPRTGSGSVGARSVNDMEELKILLESEKELIVQKFMEGEDLDADVYVDTISHKPVSIFTKKKIETKIGGASKAVSFKDTSLFEFIKRIIPIFKFNGPIDMDFFCVDGTYYLSEINPRFGGAYLHAYGCGVDFIKLIDNNVNGVENKASIGDYEDGTVMMMYDSVVIRKVNELLV